VVVVLERSVGATASGSVAMLLLPVAGIVTDRIRRRQLLLLLLSLLQGRYH
jgi:predicted MFS family arabinose efflux permease